MRAAGGDEAKRGSIPFGSAGILRGRESTSTSVASNSSAVDMILTVVPLSPCFSCESPPPSLLTFPYYPH